MALPTFRSMAARRQEEKETPATSTAKGESTSDGTLTPIYTPGAGVDVKRATKPRKVWILVTCLFFLISVVFLILTLIGNIGTQAVIRDTWFFELDLANIIPASAGSSLQLTNSLARSLGLHDFYRVGLWNFCEGYNNEGITYCSPRKTLYWFNPVQILLDELLAGATIVLPAEINDILNLINTASHVMFGMFLTGCCMNFISIFVAPLTLYSRWWSLPFTIWTFLAALFSVVAAIVGTAMFVIFQRVITSQEGVNIGARLGTQMFVFMWIGAASSLLGFIVHLCLSCCCASRRDVKSGRKRGSKKAYMDGVVDEKPKKGGVMGRFRRRKSEKEIV